MEKETLCWRWQWCRMLEIYDKISSEMDYFRSFSHRLAIKIMQSYNDGWQCTDYDFFYFLVDKNRERFGGTHDLAAKTRADG